MSRHRHPSATGIHHVMNRGVDRAPIFFADADRIEFGRRLLEIHQRFNVSTLAYCLMGNHYHLLLLDPEQQLATAMQHLGSVFVRHTNGRVGRDGPMFRARYHSIPVDTDEYLMWVSRYIHRNPIPLLDGRPLAEYRWSSYRTYLGMRRAPQFVDASVILGYFGDDVARYESFVNRHGVDHPPSTSLAALRSGIALAVAEADLVGIGEDLANNWIERTAMTLIFDRLDAGPLRDELAVVLNYPTDVARRMGLSRARQRLSADPRIATIVDRVA